MRMIIRYTLGVLALVMLLPLEALAQAKPPAQAPAKVKAVHPTSETRWNNLFQAATVLTQEGMEVQRITAPEKKQIDDFIAQMKGFIAKAKQGGISEAEEDGIDNNIAQLFAMIAKSMSDEQRKAAPATAAKGAPAPAAAGKAPGPATAQAKAVHPSSETRWSNLFQAAAVLAQEGMEVQRITAAEKKQIDDSIALGKATIAKAKQGGISEAEEDGIDAGIARLYALIAKSMSDEQRKAAPPIATAKPASTAAVPAGVPAGATACAVDGQRCNVTGNWTGVYGTQGKFVNISGSGAFTCMPGDLKVADPVPNVQKTCYVVAAAAPGPGAPPAAAKGAAPALTPVVAKAVHPTSETRWNNLFQAATVLTQEGMEVQRINAAEKKQIDDFIAQMKGFIAKAKQNGISEAEEDGIDNNIAQLYAMIAKSMSDVQRKAAPAPAGKAAPAPAKK